jgi:hypothetical protein
MFVGTGRGGLTVPHVRGALFFDCPETCVPRGLLSFNKTASVRRMTGKDAARVHYH